MSIIWKLKKLDLSTGHKGKNILKIKNSGALNLPKSNSFSNINNCNAHFNNYNFRNIFINNSFEKIKTEKKLRDKNIQLKMKLNNINQELFLAKSLGNKKILKLQQNNKLLSNAINIKKLCLETFNNHDNTKSSSNSYIKKRENDITLNGFKSNLIYKIKQQYLNLENEYKNKKEILINLKNNVKNLNNNIESKNINKKLWENFISLKNKYDLDLEKNNEYKLKMNEYIELEEKLNKKNFCILELKETLKDINDSNMNLENDIENLKNKLKILEFENETLNNQYYFLNEKFIQASKDKSELENKFELYFSEGKEKNDGDNFQNYE